MFQAFINMSKEAYQQWSAQQLEKIAATSEIEERFRTAFCEEDFHALGAIISQEKKSLFKNGFFSGFAIRPSIHFITACHNGQLEVARYFLFSTDLIKAGYKTARVNACGSQALMYACEHGRLEIVKYLLTSPELSQSGKGHADIHAQKDRAFMLACKNHQHEVVKFLIIDMKLPLTRHIKEFFSRGDSETAQYAKELWQRGQLYHNLEEKLPAAIPSTRKRKV